MLKHIEIANMAEDLEWVVLDWQPESCLTVLERDQIELKVWSNRKKTTIDIQVKMYGQTRHKFVYHVDKEKLKKILINPLTYEI